MKSHLVTLFADGSLAYSTQVFTRVHFLNMSGGYSQADGCRASNYKERVNGRWVYAGWQNRGHRSKFNRYFVGKQDNSYERRV